MGTDEWNLAFPSHLSQDQNFQSVLNVLLAIKGPGIDGACKALSPEQLDTLMKYIYRGLESGEYPVMLTWHDRCLNYGGLGCIVRALSDRRTV